MTQAVDGGLAATAADDGVAATTTTSRLRAMVAERVMAMVAGSGVVAMTATSRLQTAAEEWEMALAFDGGVASTAAGNSCRRAVAAVHVVGVPHTPNRDATRTTLCRGLCRRRGVDLQLELSSDDGGVAERRRRTGAIVVCGRRRRDKLQGGRGKFDAGLAGREDFYSRPVSIGILGDFTESGGKLAREPARLHGNGLTDDSLAPPFGQKNTPARYASLRCKPSAAAG